MLKITLSARGTRRLQFFAALWLWLEALLCWLGPAFGFALIYLNLSLWGFLSALPALTQIICSGLFWVGILALLIYEFPHVRWPNIARIKSRLERAGDLLHQPLQTLADQPMRSHPLSNVLWQHHQFSAAHELALLRWPKLHADYAPRDPFALRWLLILLALLGALQQWDLAAPRLRAAFFPPDMRAIAQLGPSEFHIYITPPAHTGLKPIYLSSHAILPDEIAVPRGSKIWMRVAGGNITPVLEIDGKNKKFGRLQENFFVLEQILQSGNHVRLQQGIFTLLNQPLRMIADQPPVVAMPDLKALPHGQMGVHFCGEDQYQLQSLTLHWHSPEKPEMGGNKTFHIQGKKLCQDITLSTGSDALAGKEAIFWLSAQNSAGIIGTTEKQTVIFPQYDFKNDWARKLARARQDYLWDASNLEKLLDIITELRNVKLPVGLYLALQNTARDLQAGRSAGSMADLWQIIMRIEEGSYADIAANWRAERDGLLENLPDMRMDEAVLLRQVNGAAEAWRAFAPAWGYDGTIFDGVWENIALQISGGNRADAIKMIEQFDSNPGELLGAEFQSVSPDTIQTLRDIRVRLMDPQLPVEERDYLEKLIQP